MDSSRQTSGGHILLNDCQTLANHIFNVHINGENRLSESLSLHLENTQKLCEMMQSVCISGNTNQETSIKTDELHGFLGVIISQIKTAIVISEQLERLEISKESQGGEA